MGGFLANYRKQLLEAIAQTDGKTAQSYRDEIAIIDAGHALYPDEVIAKSGRQRIAGRDFDVHLQMRAVTEGDVWLYEPSTRTLAAGDLVTLPVPLLDAACAGRWKAALTDLDRVQFKTLVPGHGAPMSRRAVRHLASRLRQPARLRRRRRGQVRCIDGWIADAAPLLAVNQQAFARSLLDYYVDNSLRAPKAKLSKLCAASA